MIICPYCLHPAVYSSTKRIYKKDYGMAYICRNYPSCDAYVGVHKGTKKPLGTLANPELRRARNEAHRLFDPLWKGTATVGRSKHGVRGRAYKWLAKELNINIDDCHIALFDLEMCERVIALITGKKECLNESL